MGVIAEEYLLSYLTLSLNDPDGDDVLLERFLPEQPY